MKGEIAAYITALINNHQRSLERLKEVYTPNNNVSIQHHESCLTELNDLLDFVEDISEPKEANNLKTTIMKIFRR